MCSYTRLVCVCVSLSYWSLVVESVEERLALFLQFCDEIRKLCLL